MTLLLFLQEKGGLMSWALLRLGVGATIPKDGDVKRQELSSNEKLRRQLLGRELAKLYGRAGSRGKASSGGLVPMGSKPRPIVAKRLAEEEEEEEEEEGGRTSVGKSKRRREVNRQGLEETANRTDMSKVMESEQTELGSRPRKASNYLDEVLAERQRKKQKKKRKQNT